MTDIEDLARDDVAAVEAGEPRVITENLGAADRRYLKATRAGGGTALVVIAAIGVFLVLGSIPALKSQGWSFFTETRWEPGGDNPRFGVASLVFGTIQVAVIGLVFAVPASIGAALFLTEIAPPRLRKPFVTLVDLLASVPSLIFGLWGVFFMVPRMVGVSQFLSNHLGFIPIFKAEDAELSRSPFMAGLIVAIMVLPICTSVMREVFAQTPPSEKEAALALGGTRLGMIRAVVLPFGRGGIIGGSMLGLGRALGETIAVAVVLGSVSDSSVRILANGGSTIASMIALTFGEASKSTIPALMAAGLVLFMITLVVNLFATRVVNRSRSGQGVEI